MAELDSGTGLNTSGLVQAIIKVTSGGAISDALREALETQLVIEFPDAIKSSGVIDVLSSVAVSQLVDQLLADSEFSTLLAEQLQEPTYVDQLITSLLASDAYQTAISESLAAALASQSNIDVISAALLDTDSFTDALLNNALNSSEFASKFEDLYDEKLTESDLFQCNETEYTVAAGNVVTIAVSGMTSNNYWFDYQVTAYSGGGDSNDSMITTRTFNSVTILFPNAAPGDTVKIYAIRIRCDI